MNIFEVFFAGGMIGASLACFILAGDWLAQRYRR
jgi:hypothetical protein